MRRSTGSAMVGTVGALCALLLAACSGGGSVAPTAEATSAAAQGQSAAATPALSPWTTLGTRHTDDAPEQPITTNADAKWTDYNPPALYPKMASQKMQFIKMLDGTELAAYVTLPADASGKAISGPLPTILIQTSYNGGAGQFEGSTVGSALGGADPYMVEHGYATVVVDVRGTGQSGGVWEAFGPKEQSDYGNVVKWVTQQSWFDGAIGVYGVSYLGITAIITAAQDHPAVKAAFPIVPIGDGYRDVVFTGGQVNPTFIPFWLALVTGLAETNPCVLTNPAACLPMTVTHLGNAVAKFQVPLLLKGLLGNATVDYDDPQPGSFWYVRAPLENDMKITVPTFIVGGLHDLFQRSEPLTYEEIKNHAPTKLLIGPWQHVQAAIGQGLPADGVPKIDHIELRWFDQYLKGMDVGADKLPNVTQYVAGYNHYVTAVDWPNPQASAEQLYFQANKSLSTSQPTQGAAPHAFVADPLEGLCSISSAQWSAGLLGYLPLPCLKNDNSAGRWDVNYETAPLTKGLYINGPIQANLWISSTAKDAELSVRVDDVAPDGTAVALTNGIQTASLRAVDPAKSRYLDGVMIQPWHPFTQASVEPLEANTPTLVQVEVFPTSAYLAPDHRLRISVGASDVAQGLPPLPTLLNTLSFATTLYNDAAHPSDVVLPVVPASALSAANQ
ncbi:MAG TPA: CocE/NonD family hydrolase [Nevskiaceae bacterium]|nr:CocE/NonD family hydrolase [Nevskiaceae bacterium]